MTNQDHCYKVHKHVHQRALKTMLQAALFVIIQTWKQPKYPTTAEWINIHVPEYYVTMR